MKDVRIITNDNYVRDFLKNAGVACQTINEIFPLEDDEKTYEINKIALNKIRTYASLFRDTTFRGTEIFSVLEPKLLAEVTFAEKIRKILEEKADTIFIFREFSFQYLGIRQISSDLTYDPNNFVLVRLSKDGLKVNHTYQQDLLERYRKKINFLRSLMFNPIRKKPNTTDMNALSNNETRNNEAKTSDDKGGLPKTKKQASIHLFVFRYTLLRILYHLNLNWEKKILESVSRKIQNSKFGPDLKCGFFITPSTEYEYRGFYSVIAKFVERKIHHFVFSFDLATSKLLYYKNIQHVSLYEEAYLITDLLKNSYEGRTLKENIELQARQYDISHLYVDGHFNPIIDEIFFAMSIVIICNYIFTKIKLPNVAIIKDGNRIGNAVALVSRKFRISSYSIVSLVITSDPLHTTFKTDNICIYGTQGLHALEKLGYDKERIILTGNPVYDYFKETDCQKQKKLLKEISNIDLDKKIIVIGRGRWYDGDEVWMSKLIRFSNENKFEIIIKVHPLYKTTMQQIHQHKIKEIEKMCMNLKYLITYDITPDILLPASDLIITDHSNLGMEAGLLNKPWILFETKNAIEPERRFHEYNATLLARDYTHLEQLILEILIEKKYVEQLKIGQQKLAEYYNYLNDGNAAERILELLVKDKA
ncbi:MAG: CDP-glycerol glycerophosphotransferase family protein [Nitrosopumilaceae archaeon]